MPKIDDIDLLFVILYYLNWYFVEPGDLRPIFSHTYEQHGILILVYF
jgi:hypothetical protein